MSKNFTQLFAKILSLLILFVAGASLRVAAQGPVISYSPASATYTQGTAITSATPTNTGTAVTRTVTVSTPYTSVNSSDILFDSQGNLFYLDTSTGNIYKVTPGGTTTTLAHFNTSDSRVGMAIDSHDNIYVGGQNVRTIDKVTPAGVISVFAGSLNNYGTTDGTGSAARFGSPSYLAIDSQDNIYVMDQNTTIRKITPAAVVTTFISNISYNYYSGRSVLTTDPQNNVYYPSYDSSSGAISIIKVSPAGTQLGSLTGINAVYGLTHDRYSNIYVSDLYGQKITEFSNNGTKTTLAGTGASGSADGAGSSAQFSYPVNIAADASGNIFVSNSGASNIRKITITGYDVSPALPPGLSIDKNTGTISGTPTGFSSSATYNVTASDGTNLNTTTFSFSIAQVPPVITTITPATVVAAAPGQLTLTGSFFGNSASDVTSITYGATGTENTATGIIWDSSTQLRFTAGALTPGSVNKVTVTILSSATTSTTTFRAAVPPNISYSPNSGVYTQGTAITAVTPTNTGDALTASAKVTTIAGKGQSANGYVDGVGSAAQFGYQMGIASDSHGNVYSADQGNNAIHMTTPSGVLTTIAAGLNSPMGVAIDAQDNIYVATSNTVTQITKVGNTYNQTTFASGFATARFIAIDAQGNLYVSDIGNNNVVKLTVSGGAVSNTTTFANVNQPGAVALDSRGNLFVVATNVNNTNNADLIKIKPDGTSSTFLATTNNPGSTIVLDKADNIYLGDNGQSAIFKITPGGVETKLSNGYGYQDGDLASANFTNIYGIAIDPTGNLYVDDATNYYIRKVTFVGYRTAPNLVDGLTIDPSSGTISGTPNLSLPQTIYQITASDGQSTSTVPFTMTINQVPPVVNSIAPAKVLASAPGQITLSGSFFGGSAADITSITYGADGTGNTATNIIWDSSTQIRFTAAALTPGTTCKVIVTVLGTASTASTATFRALIPPSITYTPNPATFVQGTALTSVTPVNTGDPLTASATVSSLAGSPNNNGNVDGSGSAAQFNGSSLVTDSHGNIFVADQYNNEIRKITPAGVVTTFAGSIGSGSADGTGTAAQFNQPADIAIDAQDNLYVTDVYNNEIRKITSVGVVTTLAGSTSSGSADGTGSAAQFNNPTALTVDAQGNVYVFDGNNYTLRKITPAGVVTTLAGTLGVSGNTDGTGAAAKFGSGYYTGLTTDSQGNIFMGDAYNNRIRKITPAGLVTTIATNNTYLPSHLVFDKYGNLYFTDPGFSVVNKIALDGTATTPFAGAVYQQGLVNGDAASAQFSQPSGLTIDAAGNLYTFDKGTQVVRKITLTGYNITPALPQGLTFDNNTGTISGTPVHFAPQKTFSITASDGFTSQSANYAFTVTQAVPVINTISPATVNATNPGEILISGANFGTGLSDVASITYGPNGTGANGTNIIWDNAGQLRFTAGALTPGTSYKVIVTILTTSSSVSTATFRAAVPPTVAYTGGPFVYTQTIPIAPLNTVANAGDAIAAGYQVTTLAGNGSNNGEVDSTATNASFNVPMGVAITAQNNIYVVDQASGTIRLVSPNGVVKTIAGSTNGGHQDGQGTAASFNNPTAAVADASGNLYVTDRDNQLIRKITPAGLVSTFAGTQGTTGEVDGTGIAAQFNSPVGITIDSQGNLYVSDQGGNTIRKITPAGVVTTLAGSAANSGANVDGTGAAARFNGPSGLATDATDNIYVADVNNSTIRKVTPAGVVTTIAGTAGQSGTADGTGIAATFNGPTSIAVGSNNNIYVKCANGTIRRITPAGVVTTVAGNASQNGYQDGTGSGALFASGSVYGIAADAQGNLLVPDNYSLRKITISGYDIDTTLPSGLTFNNTTGAITGTPLVTSPATTYNITASNGINSTTTQLSIAVNALPPASLAFTNGTQSFAVGSNITAFSPTNSGGIVTGFNNVTTLATGLSTPSSMVRDGAGNSYVVSYNNNMIYKVTADGTITVFAGSGNHSSTDGQGTAASFAGPNGIARDGAGNLFVTEDVGNIRKISTTGAVTTIAGNGSTGYADGVGAAAQFTYPVGIAVDASNNIYVADSRTIRKIVGNTVSTLAGSNAVSGNADGTGASASFFGLSVLTIDAQGNLYATDGYTNIRKITPAGVVTTITTPKNTFGYPTGIAADNGGNIYVADQNKATIFAVSQGGNVVSIAGSASHGNVDGTNGNAQFGDLTGLAIEGGNLYVTDDINNNIRQIGLSYYNVSPALPSGFTFITTPSSAGATPVISGIAGIVSPTTAYTVSAFTAGGPSSPSATVNITVTAPSAPSITYSPNSQVYTAGTAIADYAAINTGGAVTSGSAAVSTLAGSGVSGSTNGTNVTAKFSGPSGAVADAQGNVYVVDKLNNMIRLITPAGVVSTFAGGTTAGHADGTGTAATFSSPNALAIDKDGNIYVADQANQIIRKITSAGVVTTLAGTAGSSGSTNGTGTAAKFNNPTGIAVDLKGNVYVTETTNRDVRMITPLGVVTTLAGTVGSSGNTNGTGTAAKFNTPNGIVVDYQGNLYVADAGNRLIRKIAAGAVVTTFAGSGTNGFADGTGTAASFTTPYGIAADSLGNIYVGDSGNGTIRKITPAGLVTTIAGIGGTTGLTNGINTVATFNSPRGLNIDKSGNIYVADYSNSVIRKIAVSGFAVDKALPAGLTLDQSTGTITGTPTTPSAAKVYTITATNYGGSASATSTLTIAPSAPTQANTLTFTNITTTGATISWTNGDGTARAVFITAASTGTPAPVNNTTYTANAAYGSGTQIGNSGWYNIYNGTGSTVAVTGLTAGATYRVMAVEYNAAAGLTTYQTNTVVTNPVNFATLSTNADLTTLALSSGTLSPAFASGVLTYTASVSNTVNSLTITPTASNNGATITVNGTVINSGSASASIPLVVGSNTITVVVTAQDGTTKKTYTVTVTRISTDATLSNLVISSGNLTPVFAAGTTSYTALVVSTTTGITLTPTTTNSNATLTVNGTAVNSGSASANIPLTIGTNTITTVVTAQDGVSKQTYTVVVTRPSADATLSGIALSSGTLSPSFTAGTTNYTASVSGTVSALTVTPTVNNVNATVTVNGSAVGSGTASTNIPLLVGSNTITMVITAQDGTTKTYTVVVTRANPISNVATLSNLALSNSTLSPVFNTGTMSYTASVPNTISSITLTPTTAQANATVTVNGATVTSGNASQSISLTAGANTITTVVTAQDGTTQQTYTVVVTRVVSSVATLNNIVLSSGTLSPVFAAGTTGYTATVPNATASITLTPTTTDGTATVMVNGAAVPSGTPSQTIALAYGKNTITTKVLAQDGLTTQTYTLVVNRPALTIATLSNLSVSTGTLSPSFAAGTTNYAVSVQVTTNMITVTSTFDASATATIFGTAVPNGSPSFSLVVATGTTTIPIVVTAQDGVTQITYTITITKNTVAIPIVANNILSPNGDGHNDTWAIKDIQLYPNNTVTIYDRAGRTVYSKKGYNNEWSGTLNSAPLATGTYFYIVDLGNGMPVIKGYITILR